jgi:hypothetical protein
MSPLLDLTEEHIELLVWVEHPDLHEPESPRCGEADLTVYRLGREPEMEVVVHQTFYRRYVNMWVKPPYEGFSLQQQRDGADWSGLSPYG